MLGSRERSRGARKQGILCLVELVLRVLENMYLDIYIKTLQAALSGLTIS